MKSVKLRVFGMTCDGCAATVKAGLESKEGVLEARVSLGEGAAEVLIDDSKLAPEELELLPVFRSGHYRAQVRAVLDH
ncbi:MAG: heavy-metal-associated domain-containing protein [Conexivisphaera sp.]